MNTLKIWLTHEDYLDQSDPEQFEFESLDQLKSDISDEWADEVIERDGEFHRALIQAPTLGALIDAMHAEEFHLALTLTPTDH